MAATHTRPGCAHHLYANCAVEMISMHWLSRNSAARVWTILNTHFNAGASKHASAYTRTHARRTHTHTQKSHVTRSLPDMDTRVVWLKTTSNAKVYSSLRTLFVELINAFLSKS